MDKVTNQDIERVVDEVVRRVAERLSAAKTRESGAAAPAVNPVCGCPINPPAAPAATAPASAPASEDAGKKMLQMGACRVGTANVGAVNCEDIAPYIDHTLLKPNATETEITKLCEEARKYRFASVCVNTSYVELCARLVAGSGVKVCAVVGFPLGAMSTDSKAFETRDAIKNGAEEIDMVINVGKLQSGGLAYVYDDIHAVVRAAAGHVVKVILETGLLSDEQKISACTLAKAAGADFVKTSTGFGAGGATPEDIALMRRVVGDQMGVKASGGIRDCPTAQKMLESGATRIGASASVGIVKGQSSKSSY
jgi:deoxyribose-phosphate aldolase